MQPSINSEKAPLRYVMKKGGIMEVQEPSKLKKRLEKLVFGLNTKFVIIDYVVR